MQNISGNLIEILSRLAFPKIGIIDIIQIALIAFFVYQFMVWIKYTHAYTLLKGILVVLLFILIAYIFKMNTILWIFRNLANVLVIGVIALVVLGPERLPVVARTAGEWVGKAQRFVAQVKSDIDRETELSELKRIQDEAKALADDVKSTVEKSAAQIESDVKSAAGEAKAVAEKTQDNLKEIEETASGQTTVMSNDEISDFYGWGDNSDGPAAEPMYKWEEPKTFTKRYHAGPSVDELAQEIAKLRRELGLREAQMGGSNRRLASRARTNRPRIYR